MALPQLLVEKALAHAQEAASHSWEYSTVFHAMLEYQNPELCVFHHDAFTADGSDGDEVPKVQVESVQGLQYVQGFIKTDGDMLCEGNGSTSDPTSLIIPTLLLSASPSLSAALRAAYHSAVTRQLHTLLVKTPRYANGAISHREAYPSLWADFVYMAPPVLAYRGVCNRDVDEVRQAVRQCELYCDVLRMPSGVWRHIVNAARVGDVKTDDGAWCTGNAWATAGMARVLGTLRNSRFASQTGAEQVSLLGMLKGIVDSAVEADTHESGLLRNYLDDETWFAEVAGTALLSATVFRLAVLEPAVFGEEYTEWASAKLTAIGRHVDADTGVAAPVVNSLKEYQRTPLDGINSEGQAFVVSLYAAWRDWKNHASRSVA